MFRLTGTPLTSVVKIAPDSGGPCGAASPGATSARSTTIGAASAAIRNLRVMLTLLREESSALDPPRAGDRKQLPALDRSSDREMGDRGRPIDGRPRFQAG